MNWNKYISEEQLQAVEEAVKKAEKKTAGEIVPVVAAVSDPYPEVPFRGGALGMALCWAVLLIFQSMDYSLTFGRFLPVWNGGTGFLLNSELVFFITATVLAFAVGYFLVLKISPLRRLFLSGKRIDEEVRQAAIEVFMDSNIHLTDKHSGILIYVALFERRVEIIADKGINDAVGEEPVWLALAERLAADIKQGQLAAGLIRAIDDCGVLLASKFPRGLVNKNELPDNVQLKG